MRLAAANPGTGPEFLTELVGRDADLTRLVEIVRVGDASVTITGAPGVGKSRLAWELALQLIRDEVVSTCFVVDISEAAGAMDVLSMLCTTVRTGRVPTNANDALQDVVETLAQRDPALVLFDNAERLVGPVVELAMKLVQQSPGTRVVVTSRELGRMVGERVLRLEPLEWDDAARMFSARARQLHVDEAQVRADSPSVRELVQQLDGLPLAIELAASRARMLSPAQMVTLLSERFKLLRTAERGRSPRSATLQGTLDWSWDILEPWEREALTQCSVFAGPFTLEDAQQVLQLGPDAPWMMDALQSLYDRSLLQVRRPDADAAHEATQYRLFSGVRDYVRERSAPETVDAARDRYIAHFTERVVWHADRMEVLGEQVVLAWFEQSRANLFEVADLCIQRDPAAAARFLLKLDVMVQIREPYEMNVERLRRVMALLGQDEASRVLRARIIRRIGHDMMLRGAVGEGRECIEQVLAIMPRDPDPDEDRRLRISIALLHMREGRFDESLAALKEAEALTGPPHVAPVPDALWKLYRGMLCSSLAEAEAVRRVEHLHEALGWYQAAVASLLPLKAHRFLSTLYANIGNVYLRLDLRTEQRHYFECTYEHAVMIGNRMLEGVALANMAWLAILDYDLDRAETLLNQSLPLQRIMRRINAEGLVLQRIGILEALRERWSDASEGLLRSRDLFTRSEEFRLAIDTEILLALCRLGGQRPTEARRYAASARAHAERLDDESRATFARWTEAAAAALAGERDLDPLLSELSRFGMPRHYEQCSLVVNALRGLIEAGRTDGQQDLTTARTRLRELTNGLTIQEAAPSMMPDVHIAVLCLDRLLRGIDGASVVPGHDADGAALPDMTPLPGDTGLAPVRRLVAGPGTSWVRLDDAAVIDLERRRVVKRILDELVESRLQHPGRPVTVARLVDAAWPGQKFVAESGANRVYVAVATLRTLGLGDVLQTRSGGYLIDPHAIVSRATEP